MEERNTCDIILGFVERKIEKNEHDDKLTDVLKDEIETLKTCYNNNNNFKNKFTELIKPLKHGQIHVIKQELGIPTDENVGGRRKKPKTRRRASLRKKSRSTRKRRGRRTRSVGLK